ncbi:MAG TPA: HDIG domain-containing protein [Candidatus Coprenecus stercoravium]|uniref:HDIG domain-containing protein n=1 Tax=Candidatus Coprenecus stercoravium TaxID=2840735 RepID=A0A9D2GPL3_9BACT|nr:HDIG domain-containing protein [Candidatus Coprenecus stercoravium]
MEQKNYLKNPKILFSLLAVLVITVLLFPEEGKFKYSYQKGRPWVYETLMSPIDFPILKTQQELLEEREEKASQVIPYFEYDNTVANTQVKRLKGLQSRNGINEHVLYYVIESLYNMYSVGILPEMSEDISTVGTIVVQRDKRAQEVPVSEVYTPRKAESYMKYYLSVSFPNYDADSLYSQYGLSEYIVPNLVYDQSRTDLFHKEAVDYISPTKGMVYAGQLIVSEGEIVTAEIEQLLDSFKKEYEMTYGYADSPIGVGTGHFIICLLIIASLYAVVYFTNRSILDAVKPFYFVLTLYVLIFVLTVVIRNMEADYLYLVPYSVFAIYLSVFFKHKYVFPVYTIMLLPLIFQPEIGVELFFMNLTGGIIAIISFKYFNKGWLQFLNSLFIFVGMSLIYVAFLLSGDGTLSLFNARSEFRLAVNSLLVIAAYPVVFIFERIFSLVSHSRLVDLSDTNNKLLRELAQKAPGTFQHSLQVSNLAFEAAREIGADMILARVGALYHDIGKMNNPQCFVENAPAGVNYHKGLSPEESAMQIIRHVDDGVEIARRHKLPDVVTAFIRTHHARTLTFYFYAQYCNAGGDPENKEPFMYHGDLPKTKEQVIVLMADAVEAASRSLKDYSTESISALVDSIISKRLSDSQLVEADISIKEVETVKRMFKERLEQVYHERIAYPTIKKA